MHNTNTSFFGPPIHVYTRAQAISDGTLIDLHAKAEPLGLRVPFSFPVACTQQVWAWIEPSDDERKGYGQSVAGRLWDVLSMLVFAAKRTGGATVRFETIFLRCEGQRGKEHTVSLKALCGPGDSGEPVITIMMPDED